VKENQLLPRIRVLHRGTIAFGPGKAELLQILLETGSLNEAAKRLNMSYMRAWKLIQTMNKCFREPVATSARGGKSGGGMQLTKTGIRVLKLYQRIETSAIKASATSWRDLEKLLCA
jgi:molybdate transport system regulatory protein